MKEHYYIFFHCETNTGKASINHRSHLPLTRFKFSNQWHAKRPAILAWFNIISNGFSIIPAQMKQPFSHWLPPYVRTEENNSEDRENSYFASSPLSTTVPEMMRLGWALCLFDSN
jgi:hypothetical protein